MTNESIATIYVDGTCALQRQEASIIPFPAARTLCAERVSARSSRTATDIAPKPARTLRIPNMLASSEMFCSLLTEDFRGCAYGMFSKASIAATGTAIAVISVVALAFGC